MYIFIYCVFFFIGIMAFDMLFGWINEWLDGEGKQNIEHKAVLFRILDIFFMKKDFRNYKWNNNAEQF